ncbi:MULTISPECIES: DUF4387 domain-containing protein [Tepidanaerobacter]|uniref:DUF4387 domain-containing protein n=1 Tax=Tepidanaerobacter syntrophicus TaxID=224999 RepID=A0A0U9HFU3_9FIRM|nr:MULTISPECIES: DUF4387 domain-containing protein [Tepidanaerobacter]GAQ24756.1 hypothetical protein TSYNT_6136 [Tepidanaerobacter syntrophicus]GLI18969.1 acyl-CoA synthetase [Tepidanaerobacter syntrophicus]GLI51158.1 acyl-CoA synthetase [Tepidanaerobacter syntrophicus]HHV83718.1 DUF4387 domain-containing protein [Tepidanaerobacter syntrophicus]
MGIPITEVAEVIRSKNSGPYELTMDIIFKDFDSYEKVKQKDIINKKLISSLYQIPEEDIISIINFDPAKAIKITIKRPLVAGAIGESDVYGAQQHAPLLTIEV